MSYLRELLDTAFGKEVFYDDGCIFYLDGDDERVEITKNAIPIINAHYEGSYIVTFHPSGDSSKEKARALSGKKYIKITFSGDYAEALKNV